MQIVWGGEYINVQYNMIKDRVYVEDFHLYSPYYMGKGWMDIHSLTLLVQ